MLWFYGDDNYSDAGGILRGLVKKIVFADVLAAQIVGPAFASPSDFSAVFLLVALYAYTFQIYMDVSGYTDIARGVAALCGFRLPENFNRPYVAATVSNFWQRWHISMSSFFRDYLYFGLGGTRRGNVYINLMLTFLAIGIWHGAGWNFVVYGLIHGAVVCFERWRRSWREDRGLPADPAGGIGWLVGVAVTFHIVVFSRVLFRAPDLASAASYLQHMLNPGTSHTPLAVWPMCLLALSAALHWGMPRAGERFVTAFQRLHVTVQAMVLLGACYGFVALSVGTAPFVYFQF